MTVPTNDQIIAWSRTTAAVATAVALLATTLANHLSTPDLGARVDDLAAAVAAD